MNSVKGCSVIDVFCGVGGLTHGFIQEGFKVLAGIDCDTSCKFAYEHNNNATFIGKKVEEVEPSALRALYPHNHKKILIGCAPCQPFSQYTKKKKRDDEKWKLLYSFADLIDEVRPHIVSMENVPELKTFNKGKVYKEFHNRLAKDYYITTFKVFCPAYGIAQNRTRLVLFASKYGPIEFIDEKYLPEQYQTVEQTISDLPPIPAGGVCTSDPLHRASGLSEKNLKRISQSKPGGTWRDWDEELIAECHKKSTGESYEGVYGRMRWTEPAPTITTQCNGYGNGRFGHPEQDRAISMREAARFQSFPDEYQFLKPDTIWHIETLARLIGNAVPVRLGQAIALSIKAHLGR